jgi:hypothetical protein
MVREYKSIYEGMPKTLGGDNPVHHIEIEVHRVVVLEHGVDFSYWASF